MLSDREKLQLHVGDLRDRAVDLVRLRGRPTGNITHRDALLRIYEYDEWPLKMVAEWSEEKDRQIKYEPGRWERFL